MKEPIAERAEEALREAQSGSQSAFGEIVRLHQAMVYGMAYHFLRDAPAAEELVQEVFLELYQNLASIKSSSHLLFWLRKVTTHRCIDCARRRKARPQSSLDEAPELVAVTREADPILNRTLLRLVAALPEKARMVVVLRYQEDLEPAEIAKVLGMPVNTVKSHLHRSLGILREKLSRCLGGAPV